MPKPRLCQHVNCLPATKYSVIIAILIFCAGTCVAQTRRTIIAAIRQAGGQPRYTEYPDTDHVIWPKVVKETELLTWLFLQHR
jgi:hypothetical protein